MAYNPNILITPKEDKIREIKKDKVEKLCPFRKSMYFMRTIDGKTFYSTSLEKSNYIAEEFLSCLGKRCKLYDEIFGACKR